MKKRRQEEITQKEKDVKDLQKQRFGYEGDLFKKKQELVKPIQDKIYNAVKKMATDQSYAVIFDKSGDLIMLYTNPKYDKSDVILISIWVTSPQLKNLIPENQEEAEQVLRGSDERPKIDTKQKNNLKNN